MLSRLDDWFLGSKCDAQWHSVPVPFFLEVYQELTKSWKAAFTARICFAGSSALTTLNGRVARGYSEVPQVEHVSTVHLCSQKAATWRNHLRLPSSSPCAAKQAASALHAMAILQVHQVRALKELHKGRSDPRLMQELPSATKVMTQALGQAMST